MADIPKMCRFCNDPRRLHQCDYKGTAFVNTFNASTAGQKDAFAVLDLDNVNDGSVVQSWKRGFATLGSKSGLLIVDEYTGSNESQLANVTWALHTHATVQTLPASSSDKGFHLSSTGGSASNDVLVRVIEPVAAVLDSVALPGIKNDKNYPDPGLTKLMISVLAGDSQFRSTTQANENPPALQRIIVHIGEGPVDKVNVRPLQEWRTAGPLSHGQ